MRVQIAVPSRNHGADSDSLRHRRGVSGLARQLEKTADIFMCREEIDRTRSPPARPHIIAVVGAFLPGPDRVRAAVR